MDSPIELSPKMRRKRPFRLDTWLIIGVVAVGIFGLGLWIGERTASQPEINRRQAYGVAVEVVMRCEELFIRNKATKYEKKLASDKCQEIFNATLESGYRVREKKK